MKHHHGRAQSVPRFLLTAVLVCTASACSVSGPAAAVIDKPSVPRTYATTLEARAPTDNDDAMPMPLPTAPAAAVNDRRAITEAANAFLAVFWSAENTTLTIGQLGERLAPLTTAGFAAAYQDPAHRDQPADPTPAATIGTPVLTIATADNRAATVVARADRDDPITGRSAVWLTLRLVHSNDRWLVEALA